MIKKVAVLFGGVSNEHEVSIVSGTSVIENLDKNKYEIRPIYIDKDNNWYKYIKNDIKILNFGEYPLELEKIDNIISYLKEVDLVLPILHGKNGEDGTIQGFLELFDIKYIGCGILSSSLCMDKVYTKMMLSNYNIKQAKYLYLNYQNNNYYYYDNDFNKKKINLKQINKLILNNLAYPVFIKPSKSGSSVGISRVNNKDQLYKALEEALKCDNKIIIEEEIIGKEIECSILNNISSIPGEIIPDEEFYSYDSKYINSESKNLIPSSIDKQKQEQISKLALKIFNILDGKGLARVDFFVTENDIYFNEINTLPGFTKISMYPKMLEYLGISYSKILDKLISNVI